MILVRYLHSFDKSLLPLRPGDRAQVKAAVQRLLEYFGGRPKPIGLGLRKLRRPYWEIRASLDQRVLFMLEGDIASFVVVGSHDGIKRFLKR